MESGLKSFSSFLANSPPSLMAFPQPLPAHLHASPPPPQPIVVVAASPSKKRAAGAGQEEVAAGWTSMEYPMYSVSPPPSSVPMPTSLLLPAASGRKKAPPTACSIQVAAGVAGVDVGATDELRRLLRL